MFCEWTMVTEGTRSAEVFWHILCPEPQVWFTQEFQEWIPISAAWASEWADAFRMGECRFFSQGWFKKNKNKRKVFSMEMRTYLLDSWRINKWLGSLPNFLDISQLQTYDTEGPNSTILDFLSNQSTSHETVTGPHWILTCGLETSILLSRKPLVNVSMLLHPQIMSAAKGGNARSL